jgi:hypothetical protein
MRWFRRSSAGIVAAACLIGWGAVIAAAQATPPTSAQTSPPAAAQATPPVPEKVFQDQDAAALMSRFRQALENENRNRFLKLFDSARMPGFPVFRDEVSQFLERYQPPQINYSISQVSQDGALGAIVAEITLEATPWTDGQPVLHRRSQVRLVTSWDGKQWRIADLSPRDLFQ